MAQAKGQVVRYHEGKHKFEILTKPGSVLKYREGKLGWNNVMMIDTVFTNTNKGEIARSEDLISVFKNDSMEEVCKIIVEKGELQLSQQERKQKTDEKQNELIYYLNKNYIDPKTKLPHPNDRISNALKSSKFKIDEKKDIRKQADEAIKKLHGVLAFSKAILLIANIILKHEHVGQCNNIIHKYGNVIKEEWIVNGCQYTMELSKSDLDILTDHLTKITHGDYEFHLQKSDSDYKHESNHNDINWSQAHKKKNLDKKKEKNKQKVEASLDKQQEKLSNLKINNNNNNNDDDEEDEDDNNNNNNNNDNDSNEEDEKQQQQQKISSSKKNKNDKKKNDDNSESEDAEMDKENEINERKHEKKKKQQIQKAKDKERKQQRNTARNTKYT